MSSAAGLSRRRVAQSSSSYNDDDDDDTKRRQTPPSASPSHSHHNGSATSPAALHAGSAFEGGSKIAYDPRDLTQEATDEARLGGKMPKLTLMEEVLLLGLKDKQVRLFPSSSARQLINHHRAIFLFGMITFPMLSAAVS